MNRQDYAAYMELVRDELSKDRRATMLTNSPRLGNHQRTFAQVLLDKYDADCTAHHRLMRNRLLGAGLLLLLTAIAFCSRWRIWQ